MLKDFLKQYNSVASETLFEIPARPTETCPLINEEVQSLNQKNIVLNELIKDLEHVMKKYQGLQCPDCHQEHILDASIYNTLKFIKDLKSLKTKTKDISHVIDNELRNECLNLKMMGEERTDQIWSQIDTSITLDLDNKQFKVSPSEFDFELKPSYHLVIKDLSHFKMNLFSLNNSSLVEPCPNPKCQVIEGILELSHYNDSHSLDAQEHYNKAFQNYELIRSWVDNIYLLDYNRCINKIIRELELIGFTDQSRGK